MAENKRVILNGRKGQASYEKVYESKQYDTIGSFLICNKLNFDYRKLTYEEIYGDIDRKYWHNSILCIENGEFAYRLDFDKFPKNIKEKLDTDGINTGMSVSRPYSSYYCGEERVCTCQNFVLINKSDKYKHIKKFLIDVCMCCNEVWKYTYEPVIYLGMDIKSIYKS